MGKTASASKVMVDEALPFWLHARIPSSTVTHAGTKLSKLVKLYNNLKNKNKDRLKHCMNEEIFKGDLKI